MIACLSTIAVEVNPMVGDPSGLACQTGREEGRKSLHQRERRRATLAAADSYALLKSTDNRPPSGN